MSEPTEPRDAGAILPGDPHERRRLIIRSAVRILIATVALLVLYALVPIPEPLGSERWSA